MKIFIVSTLLFFISLFGGCSVFSPPLMIETINVDGQDGQGVAAVEIEVFDQQTEMQFKQVTDEKGMVKFPKVKNKKFHLTVPGGGLYFPVDTFVVMKNMKIFIKSKEIF